MAWPKGVKRQSKGGKMVRKAPKVKAVLMEVNAPAPIPALRAADVAKVLWDEGFDIKSLKIDPVTHEIIIRIGKD